MEILKRRQRLDVRSAAEALGMSVDAIRMRARRGTLGSEPEDGRLHVWVNVEERPTKRMFGTPWSKSLRTFLP
jgi:hypothetical protein